MAHTVPGFSQILYAVYAPSMARDYAFTVVGQSFDQEKWQRAYDYFLERVDTPDKMMAIADALYPTPEDCL